MNRHAILVLPQVRIQFWVIVVIVENPALVSAISPPLPRYTSPGNIRWARVLRRFLDHFIGPQFVLRMVEGPEGRPDLVGQAGVRKSGSFRFLILEFRIEVDRLPQRIDAVYIAMATDGEEKDVSQDSLRNQYYLGVDLL